jgi:HD-GYP domain-containing protein (c-di-GMP phosphodiesterase class II)
MLYPTAPIFFLTNARQGFQHALYLKNGFTDAFLLPNDRATLRDELRRLISLASDGEVRAFRPVQLIDIEPDMVLGFDLYLHLPANNRNIKYVSSQDPLDSARITKLQKHNVKSAMVSEDQMQDFYRFTAKRLKNLGTLSATEAKERREKAVRELFCGIFSDSADSDTLSSGRQLMNDCQEIVKAYIVDESGKTSWYEKLLSASETADTPYDHAANTATFAALLSIGLGVGDPKELALAAILHDIGLSELDPAVLEKDPKDRTPIEQSSYEKHPLHSMDIVRERKIVVPDRAIKIIEQHHESYNGGGYPHKLPPLRMIPEAQILALADRLDDMTATTGNKTKIPVNEAISIICKSGLDNPSVSQVNPELLARLMNMFKVAA